MTSANPPFAIYEVLDRDTDEKLYVGISQCMKRAYRRINNRIPIELVRVNVIHYEATYREALLWIRGGKKRRPKRVNGCDIRIGGPVLVSFE